MALTFITNQVAKGLRNLRLEPKMTPSVRTRMTPRWPATPRYRMPSWHVKKDRVTGDDMLTAENRDFIKEVVEDRSAAAAALTASLSPLANVDSVTPTTNTKWTPNTRRVGLIARKIGAYPMWLKNGKKVQTTLLQVVDNHVIKYYPPDEWKPVTVRKRYWREKNHLGCLLVGSETVDPSKVTKEYYGLFKDTGLLPKRRICRFVVSPSAALPSGTPLTVGHFRVGDAVDVRSKTIDRGFQGVMKRWHFKGMPASHGVTKTHRRPGNIGGGGEKARVWPGKKMPGHMGNKMRTLRGLKILRINYKHNVMWTLGVAIPGGVGELCYLFDTVLPLRKHKTAPPFPTYFPTGEESEEAYHESVHPFNEPTIIFPEE